MTGWWELAARTGSSGASESTISTAARATTANAKARGDQAFRFIGEAEFTKAGQVRYEKAGS